VYAVYSRHGSHGLSLNKEDKIGARVSYMGK
jgi:hypothetical protein